MTIEEAKKLFEDSGAILLSDKFTNQKSTYHYICACGEKHYKTITAFKENPMCAKCYSKTRVKLTLEEVREHLKSIGMEFLDEEYLGILFKHNIKCVCGKVIKKEFHSIQKGYECQECGKEKRRGENSWRWNPNLTDEDRENTRRYPGYYRWRRLVLERDSNKCLKCGSFSDVLNAHHVIPHSKNKELRTDVGNGATLCVTCHREFHMRYKLEDVGEHTLEEFLGGRKW